MTTSTPVVPYDLSISRQGTLADTAPLFVRGTEWTAAQHNFVRSHETELREQGRFPAGYDKNEWFFTGDGSVFTRYGGETAHVLTPSLLNPVLRNVGEATRQLLANQNYVPPAEHVQEAVQAAERGEGAILRIKALGLKKEDAEFGYVIINTRNAADKLKGDARLAYEHVFGKGILGERAMKTLYDAGHSETRIWTLIPDYATQVLDASREAQESGGFARASGLLRLVIDSRFFAYDRIVDYSVVLIRGVLIGANAAEGGTPQKDPIMSAIDTLVANPAQAKGKLSREGAAALGRISIDVLANQ